MRAAAVLWWFFAQTIVSATTAVTAAEAPVPSLAPMLAKVAPGVVNVAVEGTVAAPAHPLLKDPFFRRFFGDGPKAPRRERFEAVGSAVIIDAEHGYLLTNVHLVSDANKIVVTLQDRRELTARRIGMDKQTDVAVLKIDASGLTSVPIGDSDRLRMGDYVVAIGDPFGLGQTATFGIISALGRSGLGIEGYEDFIQTDAAINPGNSGGALVDLRGRLIGINTAILTGGGSGNVGVGFAIPIAMAMKIGQQLIAHGEVERGELGLLARDVTPEIARAARTENLAGAAVRRVLAGSPAARAAIKRGDIIVALNGHPLRDSAHLRSAIGLMTPGTTVSLEILRGGKRFSVQATLAKEARVEE